MLTTITVIFLGYTTANSIAGFYSFVCLWLRWSV